MTVDQELSSDQAGRLSLLFQLEELSPRSYTARHHEPNHIGIAYGGQVLAQAVSAAYRTIELGREATMMQATFMQGMRVNTSAEYHVATPQDGKRFSSRHVSATQGERICLDASISFQTPMFGPEHQLDLAEPLPPPESLVSHADLEAEDKEALARVGFPPSPPLGIDVKPVDPHRLLRAGVQPGKSFSYWVRTAQSTPHDSANSACAFAYLSDAWTPFAAVGAHMSASEEETSYFPITLNHSIWFFRPYVATEWLQVVQLSPRATNSRGVTISHYYDRGNVLIAMVFQEVLLTARRQR